MKSNLLDIDCKFTSHYKELLGIQKNIFQQLRDYPFDLTKNEITDAIVERMDSFWFFNVNNNKEILGRDINTTAADFFTETCLLFVKAYFEQNVGVKVYSEKPISTQGNVIRPDISIWRDEQLIAAIELKVSNGWKGNTMISHLLEREKQIFDVHPNCIFGVIAFWNFFDRNMEGWSTKYIGVKMFDPAKSHPRTNAKIEDLLLQIENVLH